MQSENSAAGVYYFGKVTVQPGGILHLSPELLAALNISSGDYLRWESAPPNGLCLRKIRIRPARSTAPIGTDPQPGEEGKHHPGTHQYSTAAGPCPPPGDGREPKQNPGPVT